MKNFKLVNGDIAVDENGNFITVDGADCIAQMIVTALKLFIKEYEYNETLGISWQMVMEDGNNQVALAEYQIQQTILQLNSYITEPELKIVNVTVSNIGFNQQRQLELQGVALLANRQSIGFNTNG